MQTISLTHEIADRIDHLMCVNHLTRRDLAKLACVSERTIYNILSANGNAKPVLLQKLADALKCTVDFLMTGVEDAVVGSGPMAVRECVCPDARSANRELTMLEAAEMIAHQLGVEAEDVLKAAMELVTKKRG